MYPSLIRNRSGVSFKEEGNIVNSRKDTFGLTWTSRHYLGTLGPPDLYDIEGEACSFHLSSHQPTYFPELVEKFRIYS